MEKVVVIVNRTNAQNIAKAAVAKYFSHLYYGKGPTVIDITGKVQSNAELAVVQALGANKTGIIVLACEVDDTPSFAGTISSGFVTAIASSIELTYTPTHIVAPIIDETSATLIWRACMGIIPVPYVLIYLDGDAGSTSYSCGTADLTVAGCLIDDRFVDITGKYLAFSDPAPGSGGVVKVDACVAGAVSFVAQSIPTYTGESFTVTVYDRKVDALADVYLQYGILSSANDIKNYSHWAKWLAMFGDKKMSPSDIDLFSRPTNQDLSVVWDIVTSGKPVYEYSLLLLNNIAELPE